jgi:hypothetical protein
MYPCMPGDFDPLPPKRKLCDPDCSPDAPECGCLHKRVEVIDSVKAKKALACVEEISNALSSAITSYGFCEKVETILRRYGQLR